jgi:hypothetical protein
LDGTGQGRRSVVTSSPRPVAHRNRPRPAVAEPLPERAAQPSEQALLLLGLDALGHDVETELARHREHRPHDRGVVRARGHGTGERRIELQPVDRQPTEVVQRRAAAAEVVDRDLHADRAEHDELGERPLEVTLIGRFAHLEAEAASGQPEPLELREHHIRERAVAEVLRGDVDGDERQPAGAAVELREHLQPAHEHQLVDRRDEPVLLGHADELLGGDGTADRMHPAGQRLPADHCARSEVHDRLEEGDEVPVVERCPQLVDRHCPLLDVQVAHPSMVHATP